MPSLGWGGLAEASGSKLERVKGQGEHQDMVTDGTGTEEFQGQLTGSGQGFWVNG